MMTFGKKHSRSLRVVVWASLVLFTSTTVTADRRVYAQEMLPGTAARPGSVRADEVKIPEALGQLRVLHDAGEGKPFVFFVQDAHVIRDAQKKIEEIILFLREKYGVRLVALEGSRGALDPVLLRSFPDRHAKEMTFESYLTGGELSGPEMAAVNGPKDMFFHGIEDWPLYRENYSAYWEASKQRQTIDAKLSALREDFDQARETLYTESLNELHERIESFYSQSTQLEPLLIYLSENAPQNLVERYPLVKDLLVTVKEAGGEDSVSAEMSLKKMAADFKGRFLDRLSAEDAEEFNSARQAFMTGALPAANFLQTLMASGRKAGMSPRLSPALRSLLNRAQTMETLQGTPLLKELEQFLTDYTGSLIQNPEQKSLDLSYRRLRILERLNHLELTPEDLESYMLGPEAYLELAGESRELLFPALRFYEIVRERDHVFQSNLEKLMRERSANSAVVIAGGFHTEGFEEALQKAGCSYATIIPSFTSLEGQENYDRLMHGEFSYKAYLKTTYFDALMRHASRRLLSEVSAPEQGRYLKIWRDEVLRDLARDGRISDAGKLTRYIDELAAPLLANEDSEESNEFLRVLENEIDSFTDMKTQALWDRFNAQFGKLKADMRALVENGIWPSGGSALTTMSTIRGLDPGIRVLRPSQMQMMLPSGDPREITAQALDYLKTEIRQGVFSGAVRDSAERNAPEIESVLARLEGRWVSSSVSGSEISANAAAGDGRRLADNVIEQIHQTGEALSEEDVLRAAYLSLSKAAGAFYREREPVDAASQISLQNVMSAVQEAERLADRAEASAAEASRAAEETRRQAERLRDIARRAFGVDVDTSADVRSDLRAGEGEDSKTPEKFLPPTEAGVPASREFGTFEKPEMVLDAHSYKDPFSGEMREEITGFLKDFNKEPYYDIETSTGNRIFIADHHQRALYFWLEAYRDGLIGEGASLYHIDAHADDVVGNRVLQHMPNLGNVDEKTRDEIDQYYGIDSFIVPPVAAGLIDPAQWYFHAAPENFVFSQKLIWFPEKESALPFRFKSMMDRYPAEDILRDRTFDIVDVDVDIFQPAYRRMLAEFSETMEPGEAEQKARQIILDEYVPPFAAVVARAKVVSIVTSPGFIDQRLALDIVNRLLDEVNGYKADLSEVPSFPDTVPWVPDTEADAQKNEELLSRIKTEIYDAAARTPKSAAQILTEREADPSFVPEIETDAAPLLDLVRKNPMLYESWRLAMEYSQSGDSELLLDLLDLYYADEGVSSEVRYSIQRMLLFLYQPLYVEGEPLVKVRLNAPELTGKIEEEMKRRAFGGILRDSMVFLATAGLWGIAGAGDIVQGIPDRIGLERLKPGTRRTQERLKFYYLNAHQMIADMGANYSDAYFRKLFGMSFAGMTETHKRRVAELLLWTEIHESDELNAAEVYGGLSNAVSQSMLIPATLEHLWKSYQRTLRVMANLPKDFQKPEGKDAWREALVKNDRLRLSMALLWYQNKAQDRVNKGGRVTSFDQRFPADPEKMAELWGRDYHTRATDKQKAQFRSRIKRFEKDAEKAHAIAIEIIRAVDSESLQNQSGAQAPSDGRRNEVKRSDLRKPEEVQMAQNAHEFYDEAQNFKGVDLEHFVYAQYRLAEKELTEDEMRAVLSYLSVVMFEDMNENYEQLYDYLAEGNYDARVIDLINAGTYDNPRLNLTIVGQNGNPKAQGVYEAVANSLDALGLKIGQFGKGVKQLIDWLDETGGDRIDVFTKSLSGDAYQLTILKNTAGQSYIQIRQIEQGDFIAETGRRYSQGTVVRVTKVQEIARSVSSLAETGQNSLDGMAAEVARAFPFITDAEIVLQHEDEPEYVVNGFGVKRTLVPADKPTEELMRKGNRHVRVEFKGNTITIIDNGKGMNATRLSRMFAPRLTSKGKDEDGREIEAAEPVPADTETMDEKLSKIRVVHDVSLPHRISFARNGRVAVTVDIPEFLNQDATSPGGLMFDLGSLVEVSETWDAVVLKMNLKSGEKSDFQIGVQYIVEEILKNSKLNPLEKITYINTLVIGLDGLVHGNQNYESIIKDIRADIQDRIAPVLDHLRGEGYVPLPHDAKFGLIELPEGSRPVYLHEKIFSWDGVSNLKRIGGEVIPHLHLGGEKELQVVVMKLSETETERVLGLDYGRITDESLPIIKTDRFVILPRRIGDRLLELSRQRAEGLDSVEEIELRSLLQRVNIITAEEVATSYEHTTPKVNLELLEPFRLSESKGGFDADAVNRFLANPPRSVESPKEARRPARDEPKALRQRYILSGTNALNIVSGEIEMNPDISDLAELEYLRGSFYRAKKKNGEEMILREDPASGLQFVQSLPSGMGRGDETESAALSPDKRYIAQVFRMSDSAMAMTLKDTLKNENYDLLDEVRLISETDPVLIKGNTAVKDVRFSSDGRFLSYLEFNHADSSSSYVVVDIQEKQLKKRIPLSDIAGAHDLQAFNKLSTQGFLNHNTVAIHDPVTRQYFAVSLDLGELVAGPSGRLWISSDGKFFGYSNTLGENRFAWILDGQIIRSHQTVGGNQTVVSVGTAWADGQPRHFVNFKESPEQIYYVEGQTLKPLDRDIPKAEFTELYKFQGQGVSGGTDDGTYRVFYEDFEGVLEQVVIPSYEDALMTSEMPPMINTEYSVLSYRMNSGKYENVDLFSGNRFGVGGEILYSDALGKEFVVFDRREGKITSVAFNESAPGGFFATHYEVVAGENKNENGQKGYYIIKAADGSYLLAQEGIGELAELKGLNASGYDVVSYDGNFFIFHSSVTGKVRYVDPDHSQTILEKSPPVEVQPVEGAVPEELAPSKETDESFKVQEFFLVNGHMVNKDGVPLPGMSEADTLTYLGNGFYYYTFGFDDKIQDRYIYRAKGDGTVEYIASWMGPLGEDIGGGQMMSFSPDMSRLIIVRKDNFNNGLLVEIVDFKTGNRFILANDDLFEFDFGEDVLVQSEYQFSGIKFSSDGRYLTMLAHNGADDLVEFLAIDLEQKKVSTRLDLSERGDSPSPEMMKDFSYALFPGHNKVVLSKPAAGESVSGAREYSVADLDETILLWGNAKEIWMNSAGDYVSLRDDAGKADILLSNADLLFSELIEQGLPELKDWELLTVGTFKHKDQDGYGNYAVLATSAGMKIVGFTNEGLLALLPDNKIPPFEYQESYTFKNSHSLSSAGGYSISFPGAIAVADSGYSSAPAETAGIPYIDNRFQAWVKPFKDNQRLITPFSQDMPLVLNSDEELIFMTADKELYWIYNHTTQQIRSIVYQSSGTFNEEHWPAALSNLPTRTESVRHAVVRTDAGFVYHDLTDDGLGESIDIDTSFSNVSFDGTDYVFVNPSTGDIERYTPELLQDAAFQPRNVTAEQQLEADIREESGAFVTMRSNGKYLIAGAKDAQGLEFDRVYRVREPGQRASDNILIAERRNQAGQNKIHIYRGGELVYASDEEMQNESVIDIKGKEVIVKVRVSETSDGTTYYVMNLDTMDAFPRVGLGMPASSKKSQFSASGRYSVHFLKNGTVSVYDHEKISSNGPQNSLLPVSDPSSVEFILSPGADVLLLKNIKTQLFDVYSLSYLAPIANNVRDVQISPDGKKIITYSSGGMNVVDIASGNVEDFGTTDTKLLSVAFSAVEGAEIMLNRMEDGNTSYVHHNSQTGAVSRGPVESYEFTTGEPLPDVFVEFLGDGSRRYWDKSFNEGKFTGTPVYTVTRDQMPKPGEVNKLTGFKRDSVLIEKRREDSVDFISLSNGVTHTAPLISGKAGEEKSLKITPLLDGKLVVYDFGKSQKAAFIIDSSEAFDTSSVVSQDRRYFLGHTMSGLFLYRHDGTMTNLRSYFPGNWFPSDAAGSYFVINNRDTGETAFFDPDHLGKLITMSAPEGDLTQQHAEAVREAREKWKETVLSRRDDFIAEARSMYQPIISQVPEEYRGEVERLLAKQIEQLYMRQENEIKKRFEEALNKQEDVDLNTLPLPLDLLLPNFQQILEPLKQFLAAVHGEIHQEEAPVQTRFYRQLFNNLFSLLSVEGLEISDGQIHDRFFYSLAYGWEVSGSLENAQKRLSDMWLIEMLTDDLIHFRTQGPPISVDELNKITSFLAYVSSLSIERHEIMIEQLNRLLHSQADGESGLVRKGQAALNRFLGALRESFEPVELNELKRAVNSADAQKEIGAARDFVVFLSQRVDPVRKKNSVPLRSSEIPLPGEKIQISQIIKLEQERKKAGDGDTVMTFDYLVEHLSEIPEPSPRMEEDLAKNISLQRESGAHTAEIAQNSRDATRGRGGELVIDFFTQKGPDGREEFVEEARDNGTGALREIALLIDKSTKAQGDQMEVTGFFGTGKYTIFDGVDRVEIVSRNNSRAVMFNLEVQRNEAGAIEKVFVTSIRRIEDPSLDEGVIVRRIKAAENTLPELDQMLAKRAWKTFAGLSQNDDFKIFFIDHEGNKQPLVIEHEILSEVDFIATRPGDKEPTNFGKFRIISTKDMPSQIIDRAGLRITHIKDEYLELVPDAFKRYVKELNLNIQIPLPLIRARSSFEHEREYLPTIQKYVAIEVYKAIAYKTLTQKEPQFVFLDFPLDWETNDHFWKTDAAHADEELLRAGQAVNEGNYQSVSQSTMLDILKDANERGARKAVLRFILLLKVRTDPSNPGERESLMTRGLAIQSKINAARAAKHMKMLQMTPEEVGAVERVPNYQRKLSQAENIETGHQQMRTPESFQVEASTPMEKAFVEFARSIAAPYGIEDVSLMNEQVRFAGAYKGKKMYLARSLVDRWGRENLSRGFIDEGTDTVVHELAHLLEQYIDENAAGLKADEVYIAHSILNTHQSVGRFADLMKFIAFKSLAAHQEFDNDNGIPRVRSDMRDVPEMDGPTLAAAVHAGLSHRLNNRMAAVTNYMGGIRRAAKKARGFEGILETLEEIRALLSDYGPQLIPESFFLAPYIDEIIVATEQMPAYDNSQDVQIRSLTDSEISLLEPMGAAIFSVDSIFSDLMDRTNALMQQEIASGGISDADLQSYDAAVTRAIVEVGAMIDSIEGFYDSNDKQRSDMRAADWAKAVPPDSDPILVRRLELLLNRFYRQNKREPFTRNPERFYRQIDNGDNWIWDDELPEPAYRSSVSGEVPPIANQIEILEEEMKIKNAENYFYEKWGNEMYAIHPYYYRLPEERKKAINHEQGIKKLRALISKNLDSKERIFLALAGRQGTGKTTLANEIADTGAFGLLDSSQVAVFHTDNYLIARGNDVVVNIQDMKGALRYSHENARLVVVEGVHWRNAFGSNKLAETQDILLSVVTTDIEEMEIWRRIVQRPPQVVGQLSRKPQSPEHLLRTAVPRNIEHRYFGADLDLLNADIVINSSVDVGSEPPEKRSDLRREAELSGIKIARLRESGEVLMNRAREILEEKLKKGRETIRVDQKLDESLVTEVDYAIQQGLLETLSARHPDHYLLGEETLDTPESERNEKQKETAEYVWIVDPIDGTREFASGTDYFGISIALYYRGEPVLAMVYSPSWDGVYEASADMDGFRLNGAEQPSLKALPPRARARVMIAGSLENADTLREAVVKKAQTDGLLPVSMDDRPRSIVVHSMKLAEPETGLDLIANLRDVTQKLWDVAAVAYLIEKAGGVYLSVTDGKTERLLDVMADQVRVKNKEAGFRVIGAIPDRIPLIESVYGAPVPYQAKTPDAITATKGGDIRFERDSEGRLTRMTDRNGNAWAVYARDEQNRETVTVNNLFYPDQTLEMVRDEEDEFETYLSVALDGKVIGSVAYMIQDDPETGETYQKITKFYPIDLFNSDNQQQFQRRGIALTAANFLAAEAASRGLKLRNQGTSNPSVLRMYHALFADKMLDMDAKYIDLTPLVIENGIWDQKIAGVLKFVSRESPDEPMEVGLSALDAAKNIYTMHYQWGGNPARTVSVTSNGRIMDEAGENLVGIVPVAARRKYVVRGTPRPIAPTRNEKGEYRLFQNGRDVTSLFPSVQTEGTGESPGNLNRSDLRVAVAADRILRMNRLLTKADSEDFGKEFVFKVTGTSGKIYPFILRYDEEESTEEIRVFSIYGKNYEGAFVEFDFDTSENALYINNADMGDWAGERLYQQIMNFLLRSYIVEKTVSKVANTPTVESIQKFKTANPDLAVPHSVLANTVLGKRRSSNYIHSLNLVEFGTEYEMVSYRLLPHEQEKLGKQLLDEAAALQEAMARSGKWDSLKTRDLAGRIEKLLPEVTFKPLSEVLKVQAEAFRRGRLFPAPPQAEESLDEYLDISGNRWLKVLDELGVYDDDSRQDAALYILSQRENLELEIDGWQGTPRSFLKHKIEDFLAQTPTASDLPGYDALDLLKAVPLSRYRSDLREAGGIEAASESLWVPRARKQLENYSKELRGILKEAVIDELIAQTGSAARARDLAAALFEDGLFGDEALNRRAADIGVKADVNGLSKSLRNAVSREFPDLYSAVNAVRGTLSVSPEVFESARFFLNPANQKALADAFREHQKADYKVSEKSRLVIDLFFMNNLLPAQAKAFVDREKSAGGLHVVYLKGTETMPGLRDVFRIPGMERAVYDESSPLQLKPAAGDESSRYILLQGTPMGSADASVREELGVIVPRLTFVKSQLDATEFAPLMDLVWQVDYLREQLEDQAGTVFPLFTENVLQAVMLFLHELAQTQAGREAIMASA